MATDNKSLGRFDLSDIPPAPRGTPQIEVAFDIDANGIMHVSAKDKATGKENKIVIKAGSGLSDEEIEKMVRDAEENADADREKRELVDAKNQGESLVHQARKSLTDLADKVDDTTKASVETAATELEEALKGDDKADIEAKTQVLSEASQKVAEQAYAEAGAAPEGAEASADAGNAADDDIVDAEFEEVDDDKKA